jgi:diacylglycerol kinase (ATP)
MNSIFRRENIFSLKVFMEKRSSCVLSSKKKNIRFIINPISGAHKKKNIHSFIKDRLDPSKFEIDICQTQERSHATNLSQDAVKSNFDAVVAVGGDGTINEVGKILVGKKTLLGIIPSGSGNGLARHLKIPRNISQALEVINNLKSISIDTFKINEHISLGMAGIGFDAHIAWKFSESKRRGFWSYLSLVLKNYPRYKNKAFELVIDGNRIVKEGLLLSFANSSQYGYDIKIATEANLNDGFIHLAILKYPPFYTVPLILLLLKEGKINKSKYYETLLCRQVEVKEKNILAHIDGEPFLFSEGMKIEVFSKSLNVIVP